MATSKRDGKKKTKKIVKKRVKKTPVSTIKTPVSTKEIRKAPGGFLKGITGLIWGSPSVSAEIRVGGIVVNREERWLFGPGEGRWWRNFAWWVIPLGVGLFVLIFFVGRWTISSPTTIFFHDAIKIETPSQPRVDVRDSPRKTRRTSTKMTPEQKRRYRIWVERK